jgi:hypothetical protein
VDDVGFDGARDGGVEEVLVVVGEVLEWFM